jgi:hypothetical protein
MRVDDHSNELSTPLSFVVVFTQDTTPMDNHRTHAYVYIVIRFVYLLYVTYAALHENNPSTTVFIIYYDPASRCRKIILFVTVKFECHKY